MSPFHIQSLRLLPTFISLILLEAIVNNSYHYATLSQRRPTFTCLSAMCYTQVTGEFGEINLKIIMLIPSTIV